MLRSLLYAHFSETLTGLPTIRSYGKMKPFIGANRYYIDLQDRGLFIVITNQRWLGVRLDFMGATLVFFVRGTLILYPCFRFIQGHRLRCLLFSMCLGSTLHRLV